MPTPLQERIKVLLKSKGLSLRKIEQELDLSHGLLMKPGNPTGDVLTELLVMFPDISAEWLMRGDGEMLKSEHEENNFFEFGSNNRNNFSPNSDNSEMGSRNVATLLQMLKEKDERIRQLTDKLLGF